MNGSKFLRMKIETRDRVGMALDVLNILYQCNVNLKAMEVGPGVVWIKTDREFKNSPEFLKNKLLKESDVIDVKEVKLLPQEKQAKHIKAVLDATSEGIMAIDKKGRLTTFNPAAEKILKIKKQKAIGRKVAEIVSPDLPMLKTISTGESYDNREMIIENNNTKSHYITSGRPILDEEGEPIGAVASLQDIENVMELVHFFTQPSMITFDQILGESKAIKRVKKMAKMVAKSDSSVILRGESGTGKELFARSIHMASPRKDKPFVTVNCAAIPDPLLESELFGYEEGAFTGAKKGGKQGIFTYADKGTLFLDEIGELSTHLQVKLLRVLQENKIRKVGANEEIPIDVRIITATNRNLEKLISTGQFREDLYYRLNVIPIWIPPLRARKDDIPLLAKSFLKKLSRKLNKKIDGISDTAMKKLINYDWPGNVRELSNVIERAINICNENIIKPYHLILKQEELVTSISNNGTRAFIKEETTKPRKLKELVAETEKKAIEEALSKCGTIRKAAKTLGVSHATVINKIKKYNIKREKTIKI